MNSENIKLTDLERSLLEEMIYDYEPLHVLYGERKDKGVTFAALCEAMANLFNAGYIDCKDEYTDKVDSLTKEGLIEYYNGGFSDEDIRYYPKTPVHTCKSSPKGDRFLKAFWLEEAEKDVKSNPDNPKSHYYLALELERDDENRLEYFLRAEKEYRKVIELDHRFIMNYDGHPYTRLGELYEKLYEHYPEAGITLRKIKTAYKHALKAAPDNYLSWYNWGRYLENNNGSNNDILNAYQTALEKAQEYPEQLAAIRTAIERVQARIAENQESK